MKGFLEYVPGESFLHKMNPVAKIIAAVLIVFACFVTTSYPLLILILIVDYLMAARTGMLHQTISLSKAVVVFSLLLAILALLTKPEGLALVSLPWGYIGTGSIFAAILIVLRLVACAIPLFLVFYVTKISDISNSLVKVLHVPYKYAFTFSSTVHFIPMFMNDMAAIMEAQTARGVEFDKGGIANKLRLMIPLCVPLLVSSVRKTNSSAIAAEVRGFNLRTRASGYKEYPFASFDFLAMLLCLVLLACAIAQRLLI